MGLPKHAGIGLKPSFFSDVMEMAPKEMWFEIHSENYMMDGGPKIFWLEKIREKHEFSFHGVGASLGSLDPLCVEHLASLKKIIDRFNPAQVSEHATFSAFDGVYYADLLPLIYLKESHDNLIAKIDQFQTFIQRRILIENPSNYFLLKSEMTEPEFLASVCKKSGCGLLLDVNNLYVSFINVGIDPYQYIKALPKDIVGEIHIAGHEEDTNLGNKLLIDTHGASVIPEVWDILDFALDYFGPTPVLLERDKNVPDFSNLCKEALIAEKKINLCKNNCNEMFYKKKLKTIN